MSLNTSFNLLQEPYSSVYAALQFSKHKSRRAARNTEDTDVVYSATR